MFTPTPTQRWPAIGLGCFFAGVTAYVLLKDVIDGMPITTTHVLTLATLVAALASGHYCLRQLRALRIISAATLAVIFAAATSVMVISSGARNAETAATKAAGNVKANDDRARLEAEYRAIAAELATVAGARSTTQVRAAMDAVRIPARIFQATAQCTDAELLKGKVNGDACRPILDLRQEMAAAIRKAELEPKRGELRAKLDQLGPALEPTGGYAAAARLLATLPGIPASASAIEKQLVEIMPFAVFIITELSTIAFLAIGLAHSSPKRTPAPAPAPRPAGAAPSAGIAPPRPATCWPVIPVTRADPGFATWIERLRPVIGDRAADQALVSDEIVLECAGRFYRPGLPLPRIRSATVRAITEREEAITPAEIEDLKRIKWTGDFGQSGRLGQSEITTSATSDCPKRTVRDHRTGDGGQTLGQSHRPDGPEHRPSAGGLAMSKRECEADLVTMLALGQCIPSQDALASRWGRPKQTVSNWLKGWEIAGTIPARRQNGRQKMLTGA